MTEKSPPLIQVPFCTPLETRSAGEYHWYCHARGSVPYVILQWSLEGAGYFRNKHGKWTIPPGHAFVTVLPEEAEYGCDRGRWTFSWLNVYGDLGVQLWRQFRNCFPPVNPLPLRSPAGFALKRLIESKARGKRDVHEISEDMFSFYTRWCRQLAGGRREPAGMTQAARQYFDEHYADPINIKELAVLAGCSREHFTREFQRDVKQSPAAYLRLRRLEAARELLKNRKLSHPEIARLCGFTSARQLRRAEAAHLKGKRKNRRSARTPDINAG